MSTENEKRRAEGEQLSLQASQPEGKPIELPCVCHLKFKRCVGNCDHRFNSDNRAAFAKLGLDVGADTCWTGLEYSLEIPGPLTSEPTLRIIRWCGVRSFSYSIYYNVAKSRTLVTVYTEAPAPL